MVFNWFRRQYSDRPDDSQNDEAKSAEPETDSTESTPPEEEQPEAVAEDYLSWAKAAYKNIQQQKGLAETAEVSPPAVTEPLEVETAAEVSQVEESATPEIAPPEITEPVVEIPQIEESATPEVTPPEITESVAETPQIEESATPEVTPPEITEPVAETPQIEESATPEVTPPEITESVAELEIATQTLQISIAETPAEQTELIHPVEEVTTAKTPEIEAETSAPPLAISPETPGEATISASETPPSETTTAEPLPFWARAQAEREARIERLKETAIEEPEETIAAINSTAAEPSTVIDEEFPVDFDEGFVWSAEILASQGRRPDQISFEEITWLQKLRQGLERTRRSLINQLKAIVGQGPLNQDAVIEIESLLLQADVGVEATDIIVNALQQKLREEVLPPEQAIAYLKKLLRELLDKPCQESASGNPAYSLTFAPEKDTLNIWLIVGVNGAGKTTTIGKIAHLAQKSDYRTLIAAADTFRAAAVEQVKVWGARSDVEVIANPGKNTDPAAVVFDAIAAAQSRNTELLIVDTAGRLQNKKNLMDELSKIRRIIDKKAPGAVVESLLVLDATLGQNGLRQAEVFSEAAQLSGVVLTKLDGTAKGGVALAVVQQLGLPIRFIGVGESIEDLRPFSSYEFVEALLSG
ncbi:MULTISPECIES: signal recognition particle-docking protein FtsY [Kamptonema]|uniref:signal recognition particle-docking protein FtsY n=1 Tax=Kamptonema TaxID=1501433 RepID=UPI0001DACCB7|nr:MULTISPECIES: signal recognition particle-docking protein FtsY [Kamptonema]CBN58120.1 signal recognition particle-docking protein FtsY [Kamptonema sp. PCC 6506]